MTAAVAVCRAPATPKSVFGAPLEDQQAQRFSGPTEKGPSWTSEEGKERLLRRLAWELHDAYRVHGSEKVRKCGHTRIADRVAIERRGTDAYYVGLARCKDVWECPVCSLRIRAARGKEVDHVVKWHTARYGKECVALLTSTIRHFGQSHDPKVMAKGVARAWRRMVSGAGWKAFDRQYGLVGWMRALEPTHGPVHGWHPHLHTILLTRRPLPDDVATWLFARWADAVLHELGPDYVPQEFDRHGERVGIQLTRNPQGDYLLKFGLKITLELLSTGTKSGKIGPDGERHRTPFQILADYVKRGRDEDDLLLYKEYAEAMHGSRMLTWSVGLRKMANLADVTPDQLLEGETGLPEKLPKERVGVAEPGEWSYFRSLPGVKVALLDIAGHWGTQLLYYAMDVLLAQADPDELERRGVDPTHIGKGLRPTDPEHMEVLSLLPRRGGRRG